MRKEVILAVIIGVLLGGIILYGINLANNSSNINPNGKATEENKDQETPSPTKKSDSRLLIIFPQNHAVVTESKITLKGSAKQNSGIAIISEADDIVTTADNTGNFSSVINLVSGENIITVTAVDEQQATVSSSITVIRTATLPE